jgi:hypothetical protein
VEEALVEDLPAHSSCYKRTPLEPGPTPLDFRFYLGGPGTKDPGCVLP